MKTLSWKDALAMGCADCDEQQAAWSEIKRLRRVESWWAWYAENRPQEATITTRLMPPDSEMLTALDAKEEGNA